MAANSGEITTCWVDGNDNDRECTTTRNTGESVSDWKQRHKDAVAAKMNEYPPA
jgi:hypothetical protein